MWKYVQVNSCDDGSGYDRMCIGHIDVCGGSCDDGIRVVIVECVKWCCGGSCGSGGGGGRSSHPAANGWTRSQPADQPNGGAAGGRHQRQVKRDQDEKRDRNENSSSPEGGSYSGCS